MNMSEELLATGCKHLTYDETKYDKSCEVSGLGSGHAVWERQGPNGFQLCQFCNQRGRLNIADACTTENKKKCSDYEQHQHTVIFRGDA